MDETTDFRTAYLDAERKAALDRLERRRSLAADRQQGSAQPAPAPAVAPAADAPKVEPGPGGDSLRADGADDAGTGILGAIGGTLGDIATGLRELPIRGVLGGAIDGIENTLVAAHELREMVDLPLRGMKAVGLVPDTKMPTDILPNIPEPESVTGGFAREASKFLIGFLPVNRLIGGGSIAANAAAGFVADFFTSAPDDKRIADLLSDADPVFRNAVINYLASDPTDGNVEARFKTALEGLGIGVATDLTVTAARGIKHWRQARLAARPVNVAKQAQATAAEVIATGQADLAISKDDLAKALGDLAQEKADTAVKRVTAAGASAADAAPLTPAGKTSSEYFEWIKGPAEDGRKVYLNLSRIETGDDIRSAMQQMADAQADAIKARVGVQSFDDVKALADEMNIAPKLLTRQSGEPMTAAEALAGRQMLTASGERVVDLAKKAATGGEVEVYAFRRALAVHNAIQMEMVDARAATARALAAWRIPAEAGPLERGDALRLLVEQGGSLSLDKQRAMAAAVSALGNGRALNEFTRQDPGKWGSAFFEAWVNGLLSSPKTHAVNVASNTITALGAIPERYLSSVVSRGVYSGEVPAGEATALAYGLFDGAKDALLAGTKTLRTGIVEHGGKVEVPYRSISAESFGLNGLMAHGVDYLGSVLRIPSRMLGAEDAFFKTWGSRAQMRALAYRQAASEGLEGRALGERITDILANPPEGLRRQAAEFADYQTFTQPLGAAGKAVQNLRNQAPGGRIVMPFVRTPINILKYSFERTPLAPLMSNVRQTLRAGAQPGATAAQRAAAAEVWGKMGAGTILMMSAADMLSMGAITGSGPADPQLQQLRRAQGIPPYGVKVGDGWYVWNRLEPAGMIMGMAADIAEIARASDFADESDKLVLAGAIAFAQNVTSKTWLQGLTDLIEAIQDPQRYGSSYVEKFASSLVPYSSLLRNVESANDPVLRETRPGRLDDPSGTLSDPITLYVQRLTAETKSRLPGFGDEQEFPPKRNIWGDPVDVASGLGWAFDFLSPVYGSRVEDDPLSAMMLDNRIEVSMPQRQVDGVKLKPWEYSEYVRVRGETARAILEPQTEQLGLLGGGPNGAAALVVQRAFDAAGQVARAALLQASPELQSAISQRQQDKAHSLMPTAQ